MESHARDEMLPAGTAVLAVASDAAQAEAVISEGAGLVDLWLAGYATAAMVRARHPGIPVCARAEWAALARDLTTALRTGAMLICADAGQAGHAEASGIARGRVLVEAPPARAAGLLAAGWTVIVTADDDTGPHAAAAVGAIACWLGATAVRTRHVAAVRRAIDMTEAIKNPHP